ncbi:MAG: hypothetical protein Q7S42_03575 [Candidatus Omnitrophota bacterium]|nr:hypothetical protein [Candidatus Omnitrophota bacterium]
MGLKVENLLNKRLEYERLFGPLGHEGVMGLFYPSDVYDIVKTLMIMGLEGKKFIDLGAGDGRIVFGAAVAGLIGTGIEYEARLIRVGQDFLISSEKDGLVDAACVNLSQGDFMQQNLGDYDAVYYYWNGSGYSYKNVNAQDKLVEKITKELRPDAWLIIFGGPKELSFSGLGRIYYDGIPESVRVFRRIENGDENGDVLLGDTLIVPDLGGKQGIVPKNTCTSISGSNSIFNMPLSGKLALEPLDKEILQEVLDLFQGEKFRKRFGESNSLRKLISMVAIFIINGDIRWAKGLSAAFEAAEYNQGPAAWYYRILVAQELKEAATQALRDLGDEYTESRDFYFAMNLLHEAAEMLLRQEARANWEGGTVLEEFFSLAAETFVTALMSSEEKVKFAVFVEKLEQYKTADMDFLTHLKIHQNILENRLATSYQNTAEKALEHFRNFVVKLMPNRFQGLDVANSFNPERVRYLSALFGNNVYATELPVATSLGSSRVVTSSLNPIRIRIANTRSYLLIYPDGVVECFNKQEEKKDVCDAFGDDRLKVRRLIYMLTDNDPGLKESVSRRHYNEISDFYRIFFAPLVQPFVSDLIPRGSRIEEDYESVSLQMEDALFWIIKLIAKTPVKDVNLELDEGLAILKRIIANPDFGLDIFISKQPHSPRIVIYREKEHRITIKINANVEEGIKILNDLTSREILEILIYIGLNAIGTKLNLGSFDYDEIIGNDMIPLFLYICPHNMDKRKLINGGETLKDVSLPVSPEATAASLSGYVKQDGQTIRKLLKALWSGLKTNNVLWLLLALVIMVQADSLLLLTIFGIVSLSDIMNVFGISIAWGWLIFVENMFGLGLLFIAFMLDDSPQDYDRADKLPSAIDNRPKNKVEGDRHVDTSLIDMVFHTVFSTRFVRLAEEEAIRWLQTKKEEKTETVFLVSGTEINIDEAVSGVRSGRFTGWVKDILENNTPREHIFLDTNLGDVFSGDTLPATGLDGKRVDNLSPGNVQLDAFVGAGLLMATAQTGLNNSSYPLESFSGSIHQFGYWPELMNRGPPVEMLGISADLLPLFLIPLAIFFSSPSLRKILTSFWISLKTHFRVSLLRTSLSLRKIFERVLNLSGSLLHNKKTSRDSFTLALSELRKAKESQNISKGLSDQLAYLFTLAAKYSHYSFEFYEWEELAQAAGLENPKKTRNSMSDTKKAIRVSTFDVYRIAKSNCAERRHIELSFFRRLITRSKEVWHGRYIKAYGICDCIAVTLYNKENKTGVLLHLYRGIDVAKTVNKVFLVLEKEFNLRPLDFKAQLIGGWWIQSQELALQITKCLEEKQVTIAGIDILNNPERFILDGRDAFYGDCRIILDLETGELFVLIDLIEPHDGFLRRIMHFIYYAEYRLRRITNWGKQLFGWVQKTFVFSNLKRSLTLLQNNMIGR